MGFAGIKEMAEAAASRNLPLWEIILEDDLLERHISREKSLSDMQKMYQAMKESVSAYNGAEKSQSGLVGGAAEKMRKAILDNRLLCGPFVNRVMMQALCVGECNACMKRIVAAPTAGSCGVLPAVLIGIQEEKHLPEEKMIEALYIAAGIGNIIAQRASIAGAEGGCQAEIGAASSMAAGAAVYLNGGNTQMIMHGAAMALKNLLGLVCDPVAGLVEVPCVKRNVIGAVGALAAADMACAGIESVIPPDEVIDAMGSVGRQLPAALRETAKGGLAATPTGLKIAEQVMGE